MFNVCVMHPCFYKDVKGFFKNKAMHYEKNYDLFALFERFCKNIILCMFLNKSVFNMCQ